MRVFRLVSFDPYSFDHSGNSANLARNRFKTRDFA